MNCARCGAANDPGMFYCVNCGNSLQLQPPPPPSFNQPPPWQGPSYGQTPGTYGQQQPVGQSLGSYGAYHAPVSNYLVPAILVTLFCCVPTGIVAIVYASQVNSRKQVGDFGGAAAAASKAQTWCWVSVGLGLIVVILNVIIAVSDIK